MSYLKKALAVLLLATLAVSFAKAELVELNPKNFKSIVDNPNKNVFVMFYAPWCGHCNNMKPAYQELANKHDSTTSNIVIARVDASAYDSIAKEYGINGFPTLKLFTKTNKKGKQYQGMRSTEDMEGFLSRHAQ